jgi:hypothetical protein
MISCPTCQASVRLLVGGRVATHGSPTCPFRRTAGVGALKAKPAWTVDQQANADARGARRRAPGATEKSLKVEAKLARQAEAKLNPAEAKLPKPPAPRVVCPVCKESLKSGAKTLTGIPAHHKASTSRWCSGGREPNAKQRGKIHRSVWSVSGGLPTLGRRR